MAHLGDFALETTVYAKFCTVTTTGAPTVLAGSPVVSVYENDSDTQITAGVTLNVDEDSVVGLNQLVIAATAANGYEAGKFYDAVITTGTVGGTSVVGYCVASFTIQATSALRPTVAARTLDVSAGGEAGVDWANVGSPTTALNLSATNIDVDQIVASVSGAVGSVTGAVGSVTGAVGSVTGLTASNLDTTVSSRATPAQVNTEADTAISDAALATAANLATVAGYLDTEIGAIKAKTDNLPASPANETTLTTIAGYLDTEVAAIKAKTDSLTFTSAGFVDANVQKVNDVTLVGDGAGTPWGP